MIFPFLAAIPQDPSAKTETLHLHCTGLGEALAALTNKGFDVSWSPVSPETPALGMGWAWPCWLRIRISRKSCQHSSTNQPTVVISQVLGDCHCWWLIFVIVPSLKQISHIWLIGMQDIPKIVGHTSTFGATTAFDGSKRLGYACWRHASGSVHKQSNGKRFITQPPMFHVDQLLIAGDGLLVISQLPQKLPILVLKGRSLDVAAWVP